MLLPPIHKILAQIKKRKRLYAVDVDAENYSQGHQIM